MAGPFVAYFRVSTDRQGRSGLGLEAQQAAVRGYLGTETAIAEFTEVETGKRNDRPQLDQALALCRKRKARLVIAKLDRLSRNLAFIAALMEAGSAAPAVEASTRTVRPQEDDTRLLRARGFVVRCIIGGAPTASTSLGVRWLVCEKRVALVLDALGGFRRGRPKTLNLTTSWV